MTTNSISPPNPAAAPKSGEGESQPAGERLPGRKCSASAKTSPLKAAKLFYRKRETRANHPLALDQRRPSRLSGTPIQAADESRSRQDSPWSHGEKGQGSIRCGIDLHGRSSRGPARSSLSPPSSGITWSRRCLRSIFSISVPRANTPRSPSATARSTTIPTRPTRSTLKSWDDRLIRFTALRDIAVDEEITVNYNGSPVIAAEIWFEVME